MATKLSERLRHFMKHRGNLSEIDLVRAADLPQPTVHRILVGTTARPHRKSLIKLARALSLSVSDLLNDTPLDSLDEQLGGYKLGIIPLLSWEEAAQWPGIRELEQHVASSRSVVTDAEVGPDGFALRMKGSSMETLFPEGTLLILDPSKPVRDKSFAIIHLEGEPEVLFKQVLLDGSRIYLKSLNPLLDKVGLTQLRPCDRVVGVAVQTRLNLD